MKNKYINRSKISEKKFREIVKLFSLDLTATQISKLTFVNRNTINALILKIRVRLVEISNQAMTMVEIGEYEADESYFGAKRARGKRGRGTGNKIIVFDLCGRNGNVYTEIVSDAKSSTLQAIIRGRADISSAIHTDGWRGYDGLVDLGYEKHYRVNHGKDEFSKGNGRHINGIEGFWVMPSIDLLSLMAFLKINLFFI